MNEHINIESSKEIRDSFTRQPCLLCGSNCKVSLNEQFEVRNSLCEAREQMYRKKIDEIIKKVEGNLYEKK